MFKHFINLELKAFFRSASLGKSIGLKIFMGLVTLYFSALFLIIGITLYPFLKETFPNKNPVAVVNGFVVFWMTGDLIVRFFLQSLPILNIKPLMILPIKRSQVIHFILLKSITSFFNILPQLVIIPFGIFCILNRSLSPVNIIVWMFAMYLFALIVNYLNFIITKKFSDNIKAFLALIFSGIVIALLEYFRVFKISSFIGGLLDRLVEQPLWVFIPIIILTGLYFLNFKYLKDSFYLDNSLQSKVRQASTSDLGWTKRFGELGPFLQLDLKLIWRNKRPKKAVLMSTVFLAYGLLIYNHHSAANSSSLFVIIGIMMSGVFMINFGQFIPSWDGNYYSLIMSQNIPIKQYIESKAMLMSVSVVICALLATPYIYYGWHIVAINLACALYNLGVNIPILLFGSSFNKKSIDLEKSPFMNYQGMGVTQWLVAIPILLFPSLIYGGSAMLFNGETAAAILALVGIAGLLMRSVIIEKIAAGYRQRKYATINGFREQEN